MKARVSFDLDLAMMNGLDRQGVHQMIVERILVPARDAHKAALHTVRRDELLSSEEKALGMACAMASMQMALMAEGTLKVEVLSETA